MSVHGAAPPGDPNALLRDEAFRSLDRVFAVDPQIDAVSGSEHGGDPLSGEPDGSATGNRLWVTGPNRL